MVKEWFNGNLWTNYSGIHSMIAKRRYDSLKLSGSYFSIISNYNLPSFKDHYKDHHLPEMYFQPYPPPWSKQFSPIIFQFHIEVHIHLSGSTLTRVLPCIVKGTVVSVMNRLTIYLSSNPETLTWARGLISLWFSLLSCKIGRIMILGPYKVNGRVK